MQPFVEVEPVVVEGDISPFWCGEKARLSFVTCRHYLRIVRYVVVRGGHVTHNSSSVEPQYVFRKRIVKLIGPLQFHESASSTNMG